MIVVDERDIIDALNQAENEDMVAELMRKAGRDWLVLHGFHLFSDEQEDEERV